MRLPLAMAIEASCPACTDVRNRETDPRVRSGGPKHNSLVNGPSDLDRNDGLLCRLYLQSRPFSSPSLLSLLQMDISACLSHCALVASSGSASSWRRETGGSLLIWQHSVSAQQKIERLCSARLQTRTVYYFEVISQISVHPQALGHRT